MDMKQFLLIILFVVGFSINGTAMSIKFQFYGTDLSVKAKKDGVPHIERYDSLNVMNMINYIEKNHIFDATVKDCLALKEKLQLNDWGYFVMVDDLAKSYVYKYSYSLKVAPIIMAYICSRSGYDIQLGLVSYNQVGLLYATNYNVYSTPYVTNNDKKYFFYKKKGEHIIKVKNISLIRIGNAGKSLDFTLLTPPKLKKTMVEGERQKSKMCNKGWDLTLKVNKNLMDFYNDYPSSYKLDNIMTGFTSFAETPLSDEVKAQLYPSIKKLLSGNDQLADVNALLCWVEFGFSYKTDGIVWGYERQFFPEESLYYPYLDSGDRSSLFARLVADLVGLKMIYMYSQDMGYSAIGVHFTDQEVQGDYYEYEGEKYMICDPAFYAEVGKKMSPWDMNKVKVFPIKGVSKE